MAMLTVLNALKSKFGFELKAAHFEHGLRGEASRQDAKLVADYCRKSNIELVTDYGHIAKQGVPKGHSEEEWAREKRYAFFQTLCTTPNVKVATAHNKNDLAETVLFHLARGAGPRGVAGIPAERGAFIRPMLAVSRAEIEAYCAEKSIPYSMDNSNDDTRYARNRIRHEVIPALVGVNSGAVKNIARFSDTMRTLDTWLCSLAEALMIATELHQGKWGYDREFLLKPISEAPPPVVASFFARLFGDVLDADKTQALCALANGERRKVQVSQKCFALVIAGRLIVSYSADTHKTHKTWPEKMLFAEGEFCFADAYPFSVRVTKYEGVQSQINKNNDEGLFFVADYDKISKCSVFRVRSPGDWVDLHRRGIKKPLRKWMNEAHIPPGQRDMLPLLAEGGKIVWVYGKGFLGDTEPHADTRRILTITCGKMGLE